MDSESGVVGVVMLFFVGAVLYFLPTINGKSRKHPNTDSIFLLNLFLGWTLIGWVAALVWSASAITKPAEAKSSTTAPEIDRYEALEKLVSMKERGFISEDEFQAEKARLLRS
ncbi:superinfection immunity protein [Pseudomonas rhodesiae]|uniref:superinfection immunity protein n=1 Tax=Pseudomonas rhodesiae TaxID=76760 RepID=UPI00058C8D9C|nr:superinfection immunity protein [Pseudomonas rhodesiae]